jgi:hypothetical protein
MSFLMCPLNPVANDGLPIDTSDKTIQYQLLAGQGCVGCNGHLTPTLQAMQKRPLCRHSRMSRLVIESG